MRTVAKPSLTATEILGRFMMMASTLVMAGFLFMGGILMGATGVGIFGEKIPLAQQIAGQVNVGCALAFLPLAFLMLKRKATRFVVAALIVTIVDMAIFMIAEKHGSGPMFGLVYAVALGISYKISR